MHGATHSACDFFCIGWECCRGRSTRRKYQSDKWSSASGLLNHLKRRPANKLGFIQKHSDWHISSTHATDSIKFEFQLLWFSANEVCAKQLIEWVDSYDWKVIKHWKYPIRWRDRVEGTMKDSIFDCQNYSPQHIGSTNLSNRCLLTYMWCAADSPFFEQQINEIWYEIYIFVKIAHTKYF